MGIDDPLGAGLAAGLVTYDNGASGLVATEVQSAIDEVAGTAGTVSSVFGRIGDVIAVGGDYTGSQVTNTPAGGIAAVTVQAAINELDLEKLSTVDLTTDVTGALPVANGGTGAIDAPNARTNLGLGSIATQDSDSVAITGGTVVDITSLRVADAVDGIASLIVAENSQANTAASLNETAEFRFGFGGDLDVARIIAGKEGDYTTGANSDSFLAFYTDLNGTAAEKMRIASDGRVGIATDSPLAGFHMQLPSGSGQDDGMFIASTIGTPIGPLLGGKRSALQVMSGDGAAAQNNSAVVSLATIDLDAAAAGPGTLEFLNTNSPAGSVVTAGQNLGRIRWFGHDGTDNRTPGADIRVLVEGTPGSNAIPTQMQLRTSTTGGVLTTGITIDNTQNVDIPNGLVTQPAQSSFLASNSAIDSNITGDGTTITVDFNTEIYDQNGDFAADTFTAPVTGRYKFSTRVGFRGLTASHTRLNIIMVTSNRNYKLFEIDPSSFFTTSGVIVAGGSTYADMDAGDTAIVQVFVSGGALVVDIDNASGGTFFSGSLIN